mmetsp:Transcript_14688/g.31913  ORF Transcript_14688/g.31913 Transcript_14688/m.31913 type:complete len:183 (+) Transcript_14688:155-703(+)|eukprot:CAMPEP_0172318960 /NCGR_PEP_ID=MMETSP1058-20130122/36328_1 /TAXON_ID=83371 /ORGANISM="Detonula confervacea, Strain CCMP 353" /LENGTH=182 /DNA_ID=CAMNT_0013033887 /DNA_START=81 /DNA_END=629 /DNA_ORIENTATION=+
MGIKNISTSLPRQFVLFLLLCFLVKAMSDSSIASSACASNGESEHPQTCHSRSEKTSPDKPPPLKTKKLVLSINAANGNVNWERVNSLAVGSNWEVQELILDNFGTIMRDDSFTAALENAYSAMKQSLEDIQPDALLASSKGVGVIAYLASRNLWASKPVILFSPIPNPIDGLVHGNSYEME